jgi:ABC-type multidrug transport system ATPase subunit
MRVTTENLGKRFNREWIFRDFSFTFSPGVYAITGPNGSGKSTLLQVLWGQLPPSIGTAHYTLHQEPLPVEDVFRHLAIATPYLELIEEFTLHEILKFHFSFKKIRGGKSLEELLDLLELAHARNKMISHFSSGMKQRLKLGLAFFSEVNLIFLDEPTTNLDKQSVAWYWKHFTQASEKSLVFIGSNLENEYPPEAVKINLLDYK